MSFQKDLVEKKVRRRLWLTMTLSCFCLICLSSFLLAPIYTSLNQNILYRGTLGMDVFYEALMLLEIAVYTIAFCAMIYLFHTASVKKAVPCMLTYVAVLLFRHVASLFMDSLNSIDLFTIQMAVFYLFLELMLCLVIVLVTATRASRYRKNRDEWNRLHARLSSSTEKFPALYPFTSAFAKTNSLQWCAMVLAGTLMSGRLLSRILADIETGWPTTAKDAIVMIIFYVLDITIGVLVYVFSLFLFGRMARFAEKANQKADAAQATPAEESTSEESSEKIM